MASEDRMEVYREANGEWSWRHKDANNRGTATAGESFSSKSEAIQAADREHHELPLYLVGDEGKAVFLRPEGEVELGPGPLPDDDGD